MKKAKVCFISLGCSKNTVNTERMIWLVREAGYEVTEEDIEADAVVINTCAFIESAKEESIGNILDEAWLKENRKLKAIIVTGCLSERYREQVMEQMPEVDAVLGTGSYEEIVKALDEALAGRKYQSYADKNICLMGGERVLTGEKFSAYLKIGEGCNNRCTYCAIPLIRGVYRSRPMEEIIEEAKWLEKEGVVEINLIAQDTSIYGIDLYGEYKLAELVRKITEATTKPFIRVLYCYPDKITDELVKEFKENARLLKYIDLPIQHISDRVLERMNRHGNSAVIRDTINRLRKAVPDITIRSTGIVGFPGETEEDFEEFCSFIKEVKFDKFGAFSYSREEDTPAYDFEDQIDEQTKEDRLDRLMSIQMDVSAALAEKKVGKTLQVLIEGYDPVAEAYFGRSEADAPDIDGKVFVSAKKGLYTEGQFLYVKITESLDYDLIGVPTDTVNADGTEKER